jgi:hypothetical protein
MKNIFKWIFCRKRHVAIDCETQGLNGSSSISLNDAKWLLRETKKDYNILTQILNSMPVCQPDVASPEDRESCAAIWEWNVKARTRHYDIGIDIENLERVMCEHIPGFKDIMPREPLN